MHKRKRVYCGDRRFRSIELKHTNKNSCSKGNFLRDQILFYCWIWSKRKEELIPEHSHAEGKDGLIIPGRKPSSHCQRYHSHWYHCVSFYVFYLSISRTNCDGKTKALTFTHSSHSSCINNNNRKKCESKTSTGPLMQLYVKHREYGQFNRKSLDSKR